jgi:hypothetical protein
MASGRVSKVKGKVLDIPNPPTIGTATAGGESVSIAFTADSSGKGGPTFSYIAKSNPGNITATGSTSPINVTGLTAGTSYTISVAGVNPTGTSEYSSASGSATALSATAYESIATTTVGSGGSSTITFSSIPSGFEHLQIRSILRNASGSAGSLDLFMNFNSDTGTNYRAYKQFGGDGSSAFGAASGTSTAATDKIANAYFLNDGNTASVYSVWVCDILDYRNTNKYKVTRSFNGQDLNGSGSIRFFSGLWKSTSAITSITLTVEGSNNFKQYTQFALYGIKGA